MILYTSDLHFGHKNVIRFDNRPFQDVEEMDRTLIELWNNRVQPDDTVYIIGDICFRASRTPAWYLSQLKGHKILILGNHDEVVLKDQQALRLLEEWRIWSGSWTERIRSRSVISLLPNGMAGIGEPGTSTVTFTAGRTVPIGI